MYFTPRHGWIGIDVGASTLTLAQLHHRDGQVELGASASVLRSQGENPTEALSKDLQTVLAMAGELKGSRVAAVMSMSQCLLEQGQLETPPGAEGQASEEDACIASWPTGLDSKSPDAGWYTMAANPVEARRVADELLNAGFSCRTIDGAPMTIARAAGMVTGDNQGTPEAPIAAIDWGWSSATFCSVISGYPVYVRTLKGCGLLSAAETLANELDYPLEDAREALLEHPPATPGAAADGDPLGRELALLLRPYFDRFLNETRKTIEHLNSHRRQAVPTGLCLLGGGSLLPGAASWLHHETQLPTEVWRPPHAEQNRLEWPLLGSAIALSALAWEVK